MAHERVNPAARPCPDIPAGLWSGQRRRGRSSGVEHGVYTAGVGGSKPSARTIPGRVVCSAQTFRASFRALPALNRACFDAGILIG